MSADELPADMEAVVARLEVAAIDPAPWPDLRALLKAYQEQRRALEAASPVVPVGVSRETLLKAVRPVLDRHPMIDSSQSHKLDIQAGWVADAILAALRPTDTGRE